MPKPPIPAPDYPTAHVDEIDGQIVLTDRHAGPFIDAVQCLTCRAFARTDLERLQHFARRITALERTPAQTLITILDATTRLGAALASLLMPLGWERPFLADGLVPVARGLADRPGLRGVIQQLADRGDARAARVLTELDASPDVTVLIAAEGTLVAVPLAELEATLMP